MIGMEQPGKQLVESNGPLNGERRLYLPLIFVSVIKVISCDSVCKPNYTRFGNGKAVKENIKPLTGATLER